MCVTGKMNGVIMAGRPSLTYNYCCIPVNVSGRRGHDQSTIKLNNNTLHGCNIVSRPTYTWNEERVGLSVKSIKHWQIHLWNTNFLFHFFIRIQIWTTNWIGTQKSIYWSIKAIKMHSHIILTITGDSTSILVIHWSFYDFQLIFTFFSTSPSFVC